MIITENNIREQVIGDHIYIWIIYAACHWFHTKFHKKNIEEVVNIRENIVGFALTKDKIKIEEDGKYFRNVFTFNGIKFHTEKLNIATAVLLKKKICQ